MSARKWATVGILFSVTTSLGALDIDMVLRAVPHTTYE